MRLYLVRHGQAAEAFTDSQRSLTERGKREIRQMAEKLLREKISPVKILHSPKLRARQSAEIFAEVLSGPSSLEVREFLNPDITIAPCLRPIGRMQAEQKGAAAILIGHLPHIRDLTAALLDPMPEAEDIQFKTGTVACLEDDPQGTWKLISVVSPAVP